MTFKGTKQRVKEKSEKYEQPSSFTIDPECVSGIYSHQIECQESKTDPTAVLFS